MALFRAVYRLVHADLPVSRQPPGQLQQPLEPLIVAAPIDQAAHDNSPHVDHGVNIPAVQRLIPGVDGVKGLAGGLHPHPAGDELRSVVQQRLEQQNGLDHALDGKRPAAVPRPGVLPLATDDVNPQGIRVSLRQLRNIVRHPPLAGKGAAFLQQPLQQFLHALSPVSARSAARPDLKQLYHCGS